MLLFAGWDEVAPVKLLFQVMKAIISFRLSKEGVFRNLYNGRTAWNLCKKGVCHVIC
jgi:hypothetical protein